MEPSVVVAKVKSWRKNDTSRGRWEVLARQFGGLEPPADPSWEELPVFVCLRNTTSMNAGFLPTITTDPRIIVRMPGGRVYRAKVELLEVAMGLPTGWTDTQPARSVRRGREHMLGNGIAVNVARDMAEWLAGVLEGG